MAIPCKLHKEPVPSFGTGNIGIRLTFYERKNGIEKQTGTLVVWTNAESLARECAYLSSKGKEHGASRIVLDISFSQ